MRKLPCTLAIVALLFAGSACKKTTKTEITDPKELIDVSQTHPFVIVDNTMVRTGPGTQFRTIAAVKRDSKVSVVGRDGDWLLIVSKRGNPPGYIEMSSVRPGTGEELDYASAIEGPYELVKDTEVRSGPGSASPVVAEVKKGMRIDVIGEEKGWLRVQSKSGNPPGYVEKSAAKPMPAK
jgi:uncharacterized protein YgiM (DUF1202 family)